VRRSVVVTALFAIAFASSTCGKKEDSSPEGTGAPADIAKEKAKSAASPVPDAGPTYSLITSSTFTV